MSYEYILVERPAQRVASITLNNPPRLNAINGDMLRELDRAVRRIERDHSLTLATQVRQWFGSPETFGERASKVMAERGKRHGPQQPNSD